MKFSILKHDDILSVVEEDVIITTIDLKDEFPFMYCFGQGNKLPCVVLMAARNGDLLPLKDHLDSFLPKLKWFHNLTQTEK